MNCPICTFSLAGTFSLLGSTQWKLCVSCYLGAIKTIKLMNELEGDHNSLQFPRPYPKLLDVPTLLKSLKAKEDELNKKNNFLSGFVAAFRDQIHTDIHIKPANNGPPVLAHRALLASRSEIFKNMFDSDGCMAAPSDTITLPELNHEELVSLVEFLYSGSLPTEKLEKHVCSLFRAAHKYEIHYLQEFSERHMLGSLNSSNALDILEFADACADDGKTLKDTALCYIAKNMEDIVFNPKYEAFASKNADLCVQITRAFITNVSNEKKIRAS